MSNKRYKTILQYNSNPDNQCYTCSKFHEYSMMAARYCGFDGHCEIDEHEVLAFRQCKNKQYEYLSKDDIVYE